MKSAVFEHLAIICAVKMRKKCDRIDDKKAWILAWCSDQMEKKSE
jgi:hypothetical protein